MDKQLQQYILARVDKELISSGCWEWTKAQSRKGYGITSKWYKIYKKSRAHQLAYIAWKGVYNKELFILHNCNNRKCCNPGHLRTGTAKDNYQDMVISNRRHVHEGDNHGRAKLTSAEVELIRTLIGKISQKNIGLMFGVSEMTISLIKRRKNWR